MFGKLSGQEERLRQSNSLGQRGESEPAWTDGVGGGLVNLCSQKTSASVALSWTWCCNEEDRTQRITTNDAFQASVDPAVVETFSICQK